MRWIFGVDCDLWRDCVEQTCGFDGRNYCFYVFGYLVVHTDYNFETCGGLVKRIEVAGKRGWEGIDCCFRESGEDVGGEEDGKEECCGG